MPPPTRSIARILGPALLAIGLTEELNLDAFAGNPAPVVYLDGTILFIAGLAIVQAHNVWSRAGSILVTVTGWACVLGGLFRMADPRAQQLSGGPVTSAVFGLILVAGGLLAWQGYGPGSKPEPKAPD
jgi:hypothetical protein